MSTLFQDMKYSYYQLLAKRLLQGNEMFSVARTNRGDCYTGRANHRTVNENFQKWAKQEAAKLKQVKGNLIPIDESLLDGFPEVRPPMCMPLDSIRIMLDKDGFRTNDPSKNVVRSSDGNVTHDWTRAYYWKAKKRDYYIYKEKIDKMLQRLEQQIQLTKVTPVITKPIIEPTIDNTTALTVTSGLVPLGILGILLLYSSGGKS